MTLMRSKKHLMADNVLMSPQKQHVLGEQGNMVQGLIDPCNAMLNEEPSAKEL